MDLVPTETQEPDTILRYDGVAPLLTEVSAQARAVAAKAPRQSAKQKFLAGMHDAFDLIGGVPRLAMWADLNPADFYKLYGRTLPTQIQASIEGKLQHIIRPALPPSALDGEFTEVPDEGNKNGG